MGRLNGRDFAALLERLQTSGEYELVADRRIDWGRYQQVWKLIADGTEWVLDYPFERGSGSFVRREEHPTAHLWEG